MNSVTYSQISFIDGNPVNTIFEDKYFSAEDGAAETEYVFLQHNYLQKRWKEKQVFNIAEFGFGTGLNFFVTADAWRKFSDANQSLYYFSVEKYPIPLHCLKEIHKQWPQYEFVLRDLHQFYPDKLPGLHRIEFRSLRIVLCLMIGDVVDQYSQVSTKFDAWYLDGFAPSRNQAMWSGECFNLMAQLSHADATFATFTSAGFVRRGLESVGFDVKKDKGFGKKREMLYGQMKQAGVKKNKDPWYSLSKIKSTNKSKSVAVIGAGIAGITTAWLLAKQGIKVTLFEKNSRLGEGASGNSCGLVMPRFNNDFSLDTQFYYTSVYQTVQWLNDLKDVYPQLEWNPTGVIQLLSNDKITKTLKTGYPSTYLQHLTAEQVSEMCSLSITSEGIYFPMAGYVSPRQLCEFLVEDVKEDIKFILGTEISRIEFENDSWQLFSGSKKIESVDAVVIANSYMAESLVPAESIKIEKNRGQLSMITGSAQLGSLKLPLVYDAYLTPSINSQQILGASYAPDDQLTIRKKDHERNIQKLDSVLTNACALNAEDLEARVSFRAYSQDRMPVVGPVHNEKYYYDSFSDLHHGKKWYRYPEGEYIKGLYLNVGHGSRGLVSSLPSSRLICDMISAQPVTMPDNIINRIHPARFLIRQLKKPV